MMLGRELEDTALKRAGKTQAQRTYGGVFQLRQKAPSTRLILKFMPEKLLV